jgi:two-component system, cell cycle response regulator
MLRLLIIEDDGPAAELTLRYLSSAGLPCACERVQSEHEFRAALAREPDLILSDSNMPGFDGMAALTIAKALQPAIPFIFVSGHMSDAAVRSARDAGATDFVPKADLRRLPVIVRSVLHRRADIASGSLPQSQGGSLGESEAEKSAHYLLQRQEVLERADETQAAAGLSGLLRRTPPSPAALVMIDSAEIRERYLKLLGMADIETEVAANGSEALLLLTEKIHALLFTDRLDLIAAARQLEAGSATHVVFITDASPHARSEGLRSGANDVMAQEARGEQFWAQLTVARRIVSFAASLRSAVTDNQLLATIDELTRVGNRRYFEHQWGREVARAVRSARPISLLICDIDHFKAINDQHGHATGDAVLTEFGDRLTHGLRLGEDWVARIGGEEFAIVLPETGQFQARAIGERLRERISQAPFLSGSLSLSVTASFGFCSLQQPAHEAPGSLKDNLLLAADAALYESKRSGRNRVTEGKAPKEGTPPQ